MAALTKIVKMRIPQNGETSATAGTFAKAVTDAIGATTAANTKVTVTRAGRYVIATIMLFS